MPEKAILTYWSSPPGGGEAATCLDEAVILPFNEQSDTAFVEVSYLPERGDAVRTALGGGGGPDIVTTPGPSWAIEYIRAGYMLPLNELADEFGWRETIFPWALDLGVVDGELYSLADYVETFALFYNTRVFEENGWEPPTTWDEMEALAEQMEAADIIPFNHSNSFWRAANEWFVGVYLNHMAGPDKVYQALTGEIPWTDPDFARAIQRLNEHQQKGWYSGGLEFYYTTDFDAHIAALASGEAGMIIEGVWASRDLVDLEASGEYGDDWWDWVPVPTETGEELYILGFGDTWAINADTANPRAAAEFLTYVFSPETQARRFVLCGYTPGPVLVPGDTLEGIDPRIVAQVANLSKAMEAGSYGYTTWTFWPPKTLVYAWEEIERVWAGELSIEEYMQEQQVMFDEELAAGDVPPIPER